MSAQPQAHTASPPRGKWVTADDRQLYDPSCPIDRIDDHPDNPPSRLDDLEELVASIEEKGVLTPVLLTPRGKRFQLLAGHRRRAAARRAGLATIPAIIRETTEQEALELLLIENLQREDLRPSEEARALQRLIDTGLSQHEVAKRVGKAQGHVSKRVALLALPVSVLRQVDSGGISLAGAAELTKLAAHPERMKPSPTSSRAGSENGPTTSASRLPRPLVCSKFSASRTARASTPTRTRWSPTGSSSRAPMDDACASSVRTRRAMRRWHTSSAASSIG